jgi:hypothetical protein
MTGQDPENDVGRGAGARVVEANGGEVIVLAGLVKTGKALLGLDDWWARRDGVEWAARRRRVASKET